MVMGARSLFSNKAGRLTRKSKPVCPPKPADLALRFSTLSIAIRGLSPTGSCSSASSCNASFSDSSSAHKLPQKLHHPLTDTDKLAPGVGSQSAQRHTFPENQTPNQSPKVLSRKRGQSGFRKDSTQSLYIDRSEYDHLHISPSTVSMVSPSFKHQQETQNGQRRFSDPDLPYTDNNL